MPRTPMALLSPADQERLRALRRMKAIAIGALVFMAVMFVVGILTSAIVGYLTIKFLLKYLATHRLDVFAYYRFALALAVWFAFR